MSRSPLTAPGLRPAASTVESVLELVGQTPLLHLNRFRPEGGAEIYRETAEAKPGS